MHGILCLMLTACKISKHTDVHEMCSKKTMELMYKCKKNIYNFENTLCDKKNILFNKIILQTCKKIDNLTNLL
jgi:hypothetical protein